MFDIPSSNPRFLCFPSLAVLSRKTEQINRETQYKAMVFWRTKQEALGGRNRGRDRGTYVQIGELMEHIVLY